MVRVIEEDIEKYKSFKFDTSTYREMGPNWPRLTLPKDFLPQPDVILPEAQRRIERDAAALAEKLIAPHREKLREIFQRLIDEGKCSYLVSLKRDLELEIIEPPRLQSGQSIVVTGVTPPHDDANGTHTIQVID